MNEVTETERALAAMKTAAAEARVRASRFGSNIAVWRDGAVVLISPEAMAAEQVGMGETVRNAKSEGSDKPHPEAELSSQ